MFTELVTMHSTYNVKKNNKGLFQVYVHLYIGACNTVKMSWSYSVTHTHTHTHTLALVIMWVFNFWQVTEVHFLLYKECCVFKTCVLLPEWRHIDTNKFLVPHTETSLSHRMFNKFRAKKVLLKRQHLFAWSRFFTRFVKPKITVSPRTRGHLAQRLKKEYRYTSTPTLGLHDFSFYTSIFIKNTPLVLS